LSSCGRHPERRSLNGRAPVTKLLFPVKPGSLTAVLIGLLLICGCGYEPVYRERAPDERYSIVAAAPKVARTDAVQEVMAGARAELGRAGALSDRSGYPRMVIEVLRIDELSAGIRAAERPGGAVEPEARGSSVAVLGRAWVETSRGSVPARDTGDVRRVEHYATTTDPRVEALRHDEAVRSAARRLGTALARLLLGSAEPSVEPM
jgi:hypothetical protein